MNDLQAHRGPNDEGILLAEDIGFGHRRLSIVDSSDRAAQPMATPDGRLWLSFNGEIHNYAEIRRRLEARGVEFRSTTDSEVLLWAYREWGSDCFAMLNGMWGAAFWNAESEELVLTRDRFGIKPLCWSQLGDRITFASEAKAIVTAFPEERRVNAAEVVAFLSGASPDGTAATFFSDVYSLPPAHWAVFRREGQPRIEPYWELKPGSVEIRDPEGELRSLLHDAVRLRLRSDVPVGACVSGGLDSSSIIRLAAPMLDQPIHCFSFRNRDPEYDESRYTSMAADDPEEFDLHWATAGPENMIDTVDRIVWHHDAPTPVRGRFPQWFTFEKASNHVKVVLDGQGADEILGGYLERFALPYLLDSWFGDAPDGKPKGSITNRISEALDLHRKFGPVRLGLFGTPVSPLMRRFGKRVWPAHRVIEPGLMSRTPLPSPRRFFDTWLHLDSDRACKNLLDHAMWIDFHWSGLPELLHAEDALGMAHGVEARPAFLDHRIVEFCFSLPFHEKIRDGWGKSVLRRSMEGILPPEIQWRKIKMGYPAPVFRWLAMEPNISRVEDLLLGPDRRTRALLDREGVAQLLRGRRDRPTRGPHFGTELVWRCLTLELWMRRFGLEYR